MVKVTKVIPMERSRLHVFFSTGESGICDISDFMRGPLFAPLSDEGFFNHVAIDEYGGIFWLNGADICPEVLYKIMKDASESP